MEPITKDSKISVDVRNCTQKQIGLVLDRFISLTDDQNWKDTWKLKAKKEATFINLNLTNKATYTTRDCYNPKAITFKQFLKMANPYVGKEYTIAFDNPKQHKKAQKRLFKMGYEWIASGKVVRNYNAKSIGIKPDMKMRQRFSKHNLTYTQFMNMELPEEKKPEPVKEKVTLSGTSGDPYSTATFIHCRPRQWGKTAYQNECMWARMDKYLAEALVWPVIPEPNKPLTTEDIKKVRDLLYPEKKYDNKKAWEQLETGVVNEISYYEKMEKEMAEALEDAVQKQWDMEHEVIKARAKRMEEEAEVRKLARKRRERMNKYSELSITELKEQIIAEMRKLTNEAKAKRAEADKFVFDVHVLRDAQDRLRDKPYKKKYEDLIHKMQAKAYSCRHYLDNGVHSTDNIQYMTGKYNILKGLLIDEKAKRD